MAKRASLTLLRKIEILDAVDRAGPHCKKKKIAEDYGIPSSTLSTILKNKDDIRDKFESGNSISTLKRLRKCSTEDVDRRLLGWMLNARSSNLCITGAILQQKAQEIAEELNMSDWTCTPSWISRWKVRHAVSLKQVSGESASVDMTVVADFQTVVLPKIIEDYEPRDTFNADETGLFWRAQPTKTLEFKGKSCYGGKLSKDRVIVMVMANSDGTEKIPLLVIGRFANPRCFKNIKRLPVSYDSNKKSWMTSSIFTSWIRKFDAQMVRQKRKVIVFLDNCSAHPHLADLRAVRLYFLPANTTAKTQPCNAGIIKNLKSHYRKKLLGHMLRWHDSGKDMTEFNITLLDSLLMLKESWNAVSPETVKNCFQHCGFSKFHHSDSVSEETSEEFREMSERKLIAEELDFDSLVDVDADLTAHEVNAEMTEAVNTIASEEEEDDEDDTCKHHMPVSTMQAKEAIDLLKIFALQNDIDDEEIVAFEKNMTQTRVKLSKQTTLDSYFV